MMNCCGKRGKSNHLNVINIIVNIIIIMVFQYHALLVFVHVFILGAKNSCFLHIFHHPLTVHSVFLCLCAHVDVCALIHASMYVTSITQ